MPYGLLKHYIFFITFVLCGCGGLSIAEHQDAVTLRRGEKSFSASASTGPEEWGRSPTARIFKAVSPSLVEPRLTFGVSDRLNFGISAWSGLLGPAIVTRVVTGLRFKFIDLGLKAMFKYRITADTTDYNVAILTNFTEYFLLGSYPARSPLVISQGVIISKQILPEYSLYTVAKYNFIVFGRGFSHFPSAHLGMIEKKPRAKWHYELIYSYVNQPLSVGKHGHVLTISGGRTWIIGQ